MNDHTHSSDGWDGDAAGTTTTTWTGRIVRFRVDGELDISSSPRLHVALCDALRHDAADMIVDLCRVSFLDSSGLAVLLGAHRRAARREVGFRLATSSPQVLRLLDLTRLTSYFCVHPTLAEALDAAKANVGNAPSPPSAAVWVDPEHVSPEGVAPGA